MLSSQCASIKLTPELSLKKLNARRPSRAPLSCLSVRLSHLRSAGSATVLRTSSICTSTVQHSTVRSTWARNQFFAPCLFSKPLFAVVRDGQKVRIRASTDGHNKGVLGLPVLGIIKTKFGIGITKSIMCSSLTKKIFCFSIFNFLNIYITKQDPRYLLLFFNLNVQLQLNYQKNLKL